MILFIVHPNIFITVKLVPLSKYHSRNVVIGIVIDLKEP